MTGQDASSCSIRFRTSGSSQDTAPGTRSTTRPLRLTM
jgi:hypothetical protein